MFTYVALLEFALVDVILHLRDGFRMEFTTTKKEKIAEKNAGPAIQKDFERYLQQKKDNVVKNNGY